MAFQSKLEIFKIQLEAVKKPSFYNLFGPANLAEDDSIVFMDLFQAFRTHIDKENFHVDTAKNKGLTAYDTEKTEESEPSILPHPDKFVIEGFVEGGKYGKTRNKSLIDSKKEKEPIGKKNIILDKYYFLLYTPLDSDICIFMLQSFSGESVTKVFLKILSEFFWNNSKKYSKPTIERFFPKTVIEDFKKHCYVKSFSYSSRYLVGLLNDKEIETTTEEFNFKIVASSKDELPKSQLGKWLESIGRSALSVGKTKRTLKEFTKGRVHIIDRRTNKPSSFEILKNFAIKPTIYLDETKVELDEENIPKLDSLKEFCIQLLEEIKPEVYPAYGLKGN